jgi:hypothetical protein
MRKPKRTVAARMPTEIDDVRLVRLRVLISEAEKLPMPPLSDKVDLFHPLADNPRYAYILKSVLLMAVKHEGVLARITEADLDGFVDVVALRLARPGHPVREGMILASIGCLGKDGVGLD